MFCRKCGKKAEGNFCTNCGEPVAPRTEPMTPIASAGIPAPTPIQPKKKGVYGCLVGLLCFLFAILVVLVVIMISAFYMGKQDIASSKEIINIRETSVEETTTMVALTKEDAREIDRQIWDYVHPVMEGNSAIVTIMEAYAEGRVSEINLYNATKELRDYARDAWGNPPAISDEGGAKYLESCRDYIIIEQTMAESLLKYLDSNKTSDLAKVQENIERCNQAFEVVASNRGVFLGINNFTDDEILEILEETMK